MYPHRWAAIAIASGGPFWSYAPDRWKQAATLPGDYARAIGRTPVWMFHGSEDNVVPTRESELMYNAIKASGGHVRLWIYQGLHHDSWARAYNEPELPRVAAGAPPGAAPEPPPVRRADRHSAPSQRDQASGFRLWTDRGRIPRRNGHLAATLFRQGEALYEKDPHGEVTEVEAEAPNIFFYPLGSIWTRLTVEHDKQGRVTALLYHDDRHEERWERVKPGCGCAGSQ